MSWRARYRQASFRGVEFKVEGHDASFGRRQATHEYPQRDTPFTEDLGRKAREFSLDAYVIGEDYHLQRDRLISACEEPGAGELIHPYLGNLDVVCTGLSVRESTAEMRMARLSLTFTESGLARYPSGSSNGIEAVSSAANGTLDASAGGLERQWSVEGMPAFVVDAAAARVRSLTTFFDGLLTNPLGQAQDVSEFVRAVRRLSNDTRSLLNSPAALARRVQDIISLVRGAYDSRSSEVLGDIRLAYSPLYAGQSTTSTRQQEALNFDAFGRLVRQSALAEGCKQAAMWAELQSADGTVAHEEAVAVRDELTDAIDTEMEVESLPDPVFVSLSKLRAEVVRGIPSPGQRLPSLIEFTPPATLPSLVLAHRLYEDASRGGEIVSRNDVRHPGFVLGSRTLQVIADA